MDYRAGKLICSYANLNGMLENLERGSYWDKK